MTTLDYVEIPSYATSASVRPAPKTTTSLPHPDAIASPVLSPSAAQPASGGPMFNLPNILLSSIPVPPATPRNAQQGAQLLTTRDPLSIPITSANFRRFVAKSGPIFWLQDRIEEVLMWRMGWKATAVWMAAYAFLCYFPRLILLVPHATLLGILLANHPSLKSGAPSSPTAPVPPPEGSIDWLANLQAIQNLMGCVSDAHDLVYPVVPHLTYSTPYSAPLLTLTALSLLFSLPLLAFLPLRPSFLSIGLAPFLATHPFVRTRFYPPIQAFLSPLLPSPSPPTLPPPALRAKQHLTSLLLRTLDNDKLSDAHWRSELREVELYENERLSEDSSVSTYAKANLRPGERAPWTRGRDGWGGVLPDGSGDVSSNLTFSLAPGWAFVETEDWRPDTQASWAPGGADEQGWVYTNDAWQDARPALTRRRRWVRRIYYSPGPS